MTTAGTIYDGLQTQQCGLLRYVDANTLSYLPYGGGDQLKINGVWRTIPTTGIVGLGRTGVFVNGVAGQNLAASTVYFVYAFMNGSVLTADYSTTSHAVSSSGANAGNEIKSGDDTRTLIGMICHQTGFVDNAGNRLVRTYYNRQAAKRDLFCSATSQIAFSATSWIHLGATLKFNFLNWANESVLASIFSSGSHSSSDTSFWGISWDSVIPAAKPITRIGLIQSAYPGNYINLCLSEENSTLTEGLLHNATICGIVNGGTCYYGAAGILTIMTGAILSK
jgi:hypothetical protein